MTKTLLGIMLGIVMVGLLAIPAQAQAPATLGACVNANNGNMRLASGPSGCRNPEVFVQWNVEGIQGAQGVQGKLGEQGEQGAQGVQGRLGAQGVQGRLGRAAWPGCAGQDRACRSGRVERSERQRRLAGRAGQDGPAGCSAPGFLDSGLQVITSTLPRPARRNRVALGLDSDSRTSPASTARCTSVETRARRGGVPRSCRSSAPTRDSPVPCG